jgi:hypothetical protein
MTWEDELDPPPQAVPSQHESNSIGKEIAGKRRPGFPFPVFPNRMNVTLSCEEIGEVNSVCFNALLRQAAWHVLSPRFHGKQAVVFGIQEV